MPLSIRFLRRTLSLLAPIVGNFLHAEPPSVLKTPDGPVAVEFKLNAGRAAVYLIRLGDGIVLQESHLGLIRDDGDFSKGLVLISASRVEPVKDRYEILTAKRRINTYRANRR